LLETGAFAVATGHPVVEIDTIVAHTELVRSVSLRGEVLLVSRAARVADQDSEDRAGRGSAFLNGLWMTALVRETRSRE
jgi:hypothetical protein